MTETPQLGDENIEAVEERRLQQEATQIVQAGDEVRSQVQQTLDWKKPKNPNIWDWASI